MKKRFIKSRPSILPQGAPTSPVISNLLALNLDNAISKYCVKSSLSYTRYADDITISGDKKDLPALSIIKKMIRYNGFTINNKKTLYLSNHRKQVVTGITVNNGIFVDKKIIREVSQELHYCVKFGYQSHLERKFKQSKIKSNYKDWLYGKICFIYSVEKKKRRKVFQEIQFN